MEGQLRLITPKLGEESDKNPSPYIHMNAKAERVFAILCPEVVDYKKYDKSTIPRDVLREIAMAERLKFFDKICIWYDDASPDPLVVGYIKVGTYEHVKHMIARFGDEILPFEMLEEKAILRLKKKLTDKLTATLTGVNVKVDSFFNPVRYNDDNLNIEFTTVTYNHRNGV